MASGMLNADARTVDIGEDNLSTRQQRALASESKEQRSVHHAPLPVHHIHRLRVELHDWSACPGQQPTRLANNLQVKSIKTARPL